MSAIAAFRTAINIWTWVLYHDIFLQNCCFGTVSVKTLVCRLHLQAFSVCWVLFRSSFATFQHLSLWRATNKIAAQNVISKKLRSLRLNFAINYISINQHSSERSKLVLGSNSVVVDVFAREFCICSCNKKVWKIRATYWLDAVIKHFIFFGWYEISKKILARDIRATHPFTLLLLLLFSARW